MYFVDIVCLLLTIGVNVVLMESIRNKIRDEISGADFTVRELLIFRRKIREGTVSFEINKSKLQTEICNAAKKALRDVFITILGILFLQLPFILSWYFDAFFMICSCVFLIYISIYITAKISNIPVRLQFKLARLGIHIIFFTTSN